MLLLRGGDIERDAALEYVVVSERQAAFGVWVFVKIEPPGGEPCRCIGRFMGAPRSDGSPNGVREHRIRLTFCRPNAPCFRVGPATEHSGMWPHRSARKQAAIGGFRLFTY